MRNAEYRTNCDRLTVRALISFRRPRKRCDNPVPQPYPMRSNALGLQQLDTGGGVVRLRAFQTNGETFIN